LDATLATLGTMDRRKERAAQIFVVRVSAHEPHLPDARWSATVVDVASGERRTIAAYEDLCSFIEERRRGLPALD
jgi:hypothetical protein